MKKVVDKVKTIVKNMQKNAQSNHPDHWRFEHAYINNNNLM